MALLPCLGEVLGGWRRCFVDHRTFRRAKEHALALLVCLGRRTISRSICVLGRQFRNWTPEYRLFSQCRWQPHALFEALLQQVPELLNPSQPLVMALDDTPCRKTGKRIRAAKILRDPLSPPFHTNFCHALRFLQATLLIWPRETDGAARAVPVAFDLAPRWPNRGRLASPARAPARRIGQPTPGPAVRIARPCAAFATGSRRKDSAPRAHDCSTVCASAARASPPGRTESSGRSSRPAFVIAPPSAFWIAASS